MRIFKNNIEITKELERMDSTSYSLTMLSTDFLYFASDFPFNHLFIKMGTVKNVITSTMKIEYFSNSWKEVVDFKDETNGLKNDGFFEFTPSRYLSWMQIVDSVQLGLSQVVYDKYWTRVSFNTSLTASIDLSFMGTKFSDDSDLFSEYPVFDDSAFMTAFKAGKTSWEDQHVKAAEIIVSDLSKKGIILSKDQLLDRKRFIGASVCKTAEIIFTAFGNDYSEQRKLAKEEYSKRLNLSQYAIDTNGNALLDSQEIKMKQGWLSR